MEDLDLSPFVVSALLMGALWWVAACRRADRAPGEVLGQAIVGAAVGLLVLLEFFGVAALFAPRGGQLAAAPLRP